MTARSRTHKRVNRQAAGGSAGAAATEAEMRRLVHELQVHSEEITVQNEQLLRVQKELELARDRYADLYDFAPVGYMTLDHRGVIVEINLQGATMFVRPRTYLVGLPLTAVTIKDHRERLRDFLFRGYAADDGPAPQVELTPRDADTRTLRLIGRPQAHKSGPRQLFIAMLEVTQERQLESDRQLAYSLEQARAAELMKEIGVRVAAEERVKTLLDRLLAVQEQERRRLALNLHDQLGQQLTALKLTVGALKEAGLSPDDRHARLEIIESLVAQLDRDVDFLAWELRPAALDEIGLEAALAEFLRHWSAIRGIPVEFHGSASDAPRLAPDLESHLYRMAQEGLNNVAKHANARHVSMLLERRGDEVLLIIEDDGRGFDPGHVRSDAFKGGMGLPGIRERAAAVGGSVVVESSPGSGTTLFVRAPFKGVPAGSGR